MGPENRLINAVKKELGSDVYSEKMHNAYRGGTPDVWYSGRGGDLWVEWKWIASVPKKGPIVPNLSELQKQWLGRRVDVQEGGRRLDPVALRALMRFVGALTGAANSMSAVYRIVFTGLLLIELVRFARDRRKHVQAAHYPRPHRGGRRSRKEVAPWS
jgi:hypothetical protein